MERQLLRALLVCPSCRAPLAPGLDRLDCRACGASFEIQGGVPIFLSFVERERVRALREVWGGERVTTPNNARMLDWLRRWVPPPAPFLNPVSRRNLSRLRGELEAVRREVTLLDLGSGDGSGAGMAALGPVLLEQRSVRLDVDAFPGVEVVAPGSRLPFADATFDAVLLKAVLEHVPDPEQVVAECLRTLMPGGTLYVEVPFLFEYHPNPGDYQRYTRAGLERLLEGFERVEVGTLIGPFGALASLTAHALALLLSFRSRLLRKGLLPLLTWVTWPLSLPDLVIASHPGAHFVAHHLYAFARRPALHAASRQETSATQPAGARS